MARRSRVLAERVCSEVVLTTKQGDAFRGVLFEADDKVFCLRNTTLLSGPNGSHLTVDGEVLVLAADVSFVQVLA
jgi:hypothetical protein